MQNGLKHVLFLGALTLVLGAGTTMAFTRIILPDGAVASPSLTFGNDLNTGMYRSDAGTVGVVVHGRDSVWFLDGNTASMNVSANVVSGSGTAMCLTNTPSNCDLAVATPTNGLYFTSSGILSVDNSALPSLCGSLDLLGDPIHISGRAASGVYLTADTTATAGAVTGSLLLQGMALVVDLTGGNPGGVASSTASVQTDGLVASSSPLVPFSVGPTAAIAASTKLGSFVCTQRCKVTKGWGKALTAGTGGTTAPTMVVTDGTNTCTLTSGSGCNAAIDTDESFTTSGACTFAAAARLNVSATRGNCTVGPSFYNLAVEINNQ